jgi:tRNA dimethylallyltransferase
MDNDLPKLIIIIGPTSAGKSDLAIALAKRSEGEIISADSRQVYRGMDIGTGKVPKDFSEKNRGEYLSEGIIHHLIDIADPKEDYNVSHFVHDAKEAIADIRRRGKLPIICGGTHFWIEALLSGNTLPAVKPDPTLRAALNKHSTEELFVLLEEKDPARAASIDKHNKIRLIRAIEIIETLGKVPQLQKKQQSRIENRDTLIIALVPDKKILHERIAKRLEKRIAEGMIEEVERLHTEGISWERLESFGLEYRHIALFLQKKISREKMLVELEMEIRRYAKRQFTFLRRMERSGLPIFHASNLNDALSYISGNIRTSLRNKIRNTMHIALDHIRKNLRGYIDI